MKVLLDEGYSVTTGVLNVLDTDLETAQLLKIPVITEAPFSPITETAHKANLEMIKRARIVVLTSVPFGYGNFRNLEAAEESVSQGVPTFVIEEVPIESRDFTQGKVAKLFLKLKKMGAIPVKNQTELLKLLHVSAEKLKIAKNHTAELLDHMKPEGKFKERKV